MIHLHCVLNRKLRTQAFFIQKAKIGKAWAWQIDTKADLSLSMLFIYKPIDDCLILCSCNRYFVRGVVNIPCMN